MKNEIRPQKGPQENFLNCRADLALFGGSAGSGKSHALLLEPLRHLNNPKFDSILFRRNSTQVRNPGGLWSKSLELYHLFQGHPREAYLEWKFPKGMSMKFAHLENIDTVYNYQGSEIPLIMWDELTHFEKTQFWYMLSRLRSTSGVPGYMRMTCNPDSDSWVRELIDWWIGPEGYPISERSGVLRWFIRQDETLMWGNSKEELESKYGQDSLPKSFTFIPAKIYDNKILLEKDPSYLANLKALSRVDRERLLYGNWNVRASGGTLFQRTWFPLIDAVPAGWNRMIRYWDRGATKPHETNPNPDWTRGLKVLHYPDGSFCVTDLKSIRDTPGQIEAFIKGVASHDSRSCEIIGEQDPGSAGVIDAHHFIRMLAGFIVRMRTNSKDKVTRAKPASAQAEVGNIKVLRAPWNEDFFRELENFPSPSSHDDIVDTLSGSIDELTQGLSICDVLF